MKGSAGNTSIETAAFQRFMAAGTKPKRHRDRAAKEQSLLEAATKLFARQGYEVTTTREIAAFAGCAEGLIHRYFSGKAGLLLTVIQNRASDEVEDLNLRMPLAAKFNDEFHQLVDWELERMWDDRDFLRVIIPRALVDPAFSTVLGQVSTSRHSEAIVQRLKKFKECKSLSAEELHGLARFVGLLGFGFGFLRPVALGQDRGRAKNMAHSITKILLRGI